MRLRLAPECRAPLGPILGARRSATRTVLHALVRPVAALLLLVTCTLALQSWLSSVVVGWRPLDIERRHAQASYGGFLAAMRDYENQDPLFCIDPEGLAALDVMLNLLRNIRPEAKDTHLSIMQSKTANAFSFGGGYVLVLSEIIENAESDTEVFAMLAHELGHDRARHAERMASEAVSVAGLASTLFNTLVPDFAVVIAGASYSMPIRSRQMEREADLYAIEVMLQLGIDPGAGADLMRQLSENDEHGYDFFSTHPSYAERIDMFASASRPGGSILNARQWRALKSICRTTTKTAPAFPPEPSL